MNSVIYSTWSLKFRTLHTFNFNWSEAEWREQRDRPIKESDNLMGLTGIDPCDHPSVCLSGLSPKTSQAFGRFEPSHICYLLQLPQPTTADTFKPEGSVMHPEAPQVSKIPIPQAHWVKNSPCQPFINQSVSIKSLWLTRNLGWSHITLSLALFMSWCWQHHLQSFPVTVQWVTCVPSPQPDAGKHHRVKTVISGPAVLASLHPLQKQTA